MASVDRLGYVGLAFFVTEENRSRLVGAIRLFLLFLPGLTSDTNAGAARVDAKP